MTKETNKIVLTLDAGGTNFVFSAVQNYKEIVEPITIAACTDDLQKCLDSIVLGFNQVMKNLQEKPIAISFAFPGPADYKNGIIGDLPNFKAFRGGVALGPFLEKKLQLPVFINNDGNLFAYGEALYGALPMVNRWLTDAGNTKQYKNLLGITLGTGFGAGVVLDSILLTGDNDCGGDLWNLKNKKYPSAIVEDSVSIRAVKRVYHELEKEDTRDLCPKDIFDIAEGTLAGNKDAAIKSFEELGEMAGDVLSQALTLIDGILVIGGGLAGALKYITPSLLKELRAQTSTLSGGTFPRLQMDVFDLSLENERNSFLESENSFVAVPGYADSIPYNKSKRIGVLVSEIGTNKSVMYGAYAYALNNIKI